MAGSYVPFEKSGETCSRREHWHTPMAPTRSRRRKSTPARRVVKTRRWRDLNSDKPELWDENIELSVFAVQPMVYTFAPKAFRETRAGTAEMVKRTIEASRDLGGLTADVILKHPSILETLRMCCCPPIARDRLIGLARVPDSVVDTLEEGKLPTRMNAQLLKTNVNKIVTILKAMLDEDLFPWLEPERTATDAERTRASTVIADRPLLRSHESDCPQRTRRATNNRDQAVLATKGVRRGATSKPKIDETRDVLLSLQCPSHDRRRPGEHSD